jgi:hypothetical protein
MALEPDRTPEPDEQINLTDPDARLMRKHKRESYTQSYNAQAVVDAVAQSAENGKWVDVL